MIAPWWAYLILSGICSLEADSHARDGKLGWACFERVLSIIFAFLAVYQLAAGK